ncbi:hypothetical protein LCGC14_2289500 [marine sediment metagenome]|uniref:Uncharacterized protein n=1 Tax=marine sediment metagenome TaxID=412755 RepID=A0A0F9CRK4_9ZZZZ
MAEELKTVLGFEASGAISTLNTLSTALDKYTAAIASAASATTRYNKAAAGVDSKLKSLTAASSGYSKVQQQSVSASKRVQTALSKERELLQSVRGAVNNVGKATKKTSGQNKCFSRYFNNLWTEI